MTTGDLQRFGVRAAGGGAVFALALTYIPADQSFWLTPVVALLGALLGFWLLRWYANRTVGDKAGKRPDRMVS